VQPECCALPASLPHASSEEQRLLDAALDAVERAARLCVSLSDKDARLKSDQTPVTVADYAVQALVTLSLRTAFPEELIVAEEDAAALLADRTLLTSVHRAVLAHSSVTHTEAALLQALSSSRTADTSTRRWILDPIDGTRAFVAGGNQQYAVGLALSDDAFPSSPTLGVMALPNWSLPPCSASSRGLLLCALKGSGCWARRLDEPHWTRVFCDGQSSLSNAVVAVSDHETWADTPLGRASTEAPQRTLPLCCGSLVKHAAVALGLASLFVQQPIAERASRLLGWDHAAGIACVQEAGGLVLDFHGKQVRLGRGPHFAPGGQALFSCSAPLAPAMLRLLPPRSSRPLICLLDRDGTVNVDVGPPGVVSSAQLRLVPGAAQALASLSSVGVTLALVTNQSAVGKGLLSEQGLAEIHASLAELLRAEGGPDARLHASFHCSDRAPSPRRKPSPGMLLEALSWFGAQPADAAMVGDTATDMAAAAAAGVSRRLLLCTGHGRVFAEAAVEAGVSLPTRIDEGSPLARLLPPETLPVELHADVLSALESLEKQD